MEGKTDPGKKRGESRRALRLGSPERPLEGKAAAKRPAPRAGAWEADEVGNARGEDEAAEVTGRVSLAGAECNVS